MTTTQPSARRHVMIVKHEENSALNVLKHDKAPVETLETSDNGDFERLTRDPNKRSTLTALPTSPAKIVVVTNKEEERRPT